MASAKSAKEEYMEALAALGSKSKALRETPWEFASVKRRFAPRFHGGAAINMLASAHVIESSAVARGIKRPVALGGPA